jgi:hypothetical protein
MLAYHGMDARLDYQFSYDNGVKDASFQLNRSGESCDLFFECYDAIGTFYRNTLDVNTEFISIATTNANSGNISRLLLDPNEATLFGNEKIKLIVGNPNEAVEITGSANVSGNFIAGGTVNFAGLPSYANDSEAAAGGAQIGDLYRNGNFIQIRIS